MYRRSVLKRWPQLVTAILTILFLSLPVGCAHLRQCGCPDCNENPIVLSPTGAPFFDKDGELLRFDQWLRQETSSDQCYYRVAPIIAGERGCYVEIYLWPKSKGEAEPTTDKTCIFYLLIWTGHQDESALGISKVEIFHQMSPDEIERLETLRTQL